MFILSALLLVAAVVYVAYKITRKKTLRLLSFVFLVAALAAGIWGAWFSDVDDVEAVAAETALLERVPVARFAAAVEYLSQQKPKLKGRILIIHNDQLDWQDRELKESADRLQGSRYQWVLCGLGPFDAGESQRCLSALRQAQNVAAVIVLAGKASGESLVGSKLAKEQTPILFASGLLSEDWHPKEDYPHVIAGLETTLNSEVLQRLSKKKNSLAEIFSATSKWVVYSSE